MEQEERRFRALDFLLDYSKGTLWWVNDHLWEDTIPGFVRKRDGHPALSLSRKRVTGLYDPVVMAIGTTKSVKGGFAVKNVSEPVKIGMDRITNFHVLRPWRIRFNDFGSAEGVTANAYKPRLSRAELDRLDKLLFGGK